MGTPASVPVGYRFHPTDEELVVHYLNHKLRSDDSNVHNIIAELDICKFEPWDLPAYSKVISDDPEWFFFSPLGFKYTNSNRCNRATKAGYWKATGKDRKIKKRGTNNVIGTKKTLVFHKGRASHGVKTNWVIHEYHAVTFNDDKRNFVLCRLMEKAEKKSEKKAERGPDAMMHDEREPSSHIAANYENQATVDRIPDVYTPPEVNMESIFEAQLQAEKYDFTLVEQSLIAMEHEPYFPGSTFPSVYFGNENNTMQFQFETTEDEDIVDLFLNSNLAEKDDFFSEETTHAFVNDTTPSQPLRKVYHESSGTDAELLSARHGKIMDTTSSVCNEHTGSGENPVQKEIHILEPNKEQRKGQGTSSRKDVETIRGQSSGVDEKGSSICLETPLSMNLLPYGYIPYPTSSTCHEHTGSRENPVISIVKSSHDAVYAVPPALSSENEVNLENKDNTFADDVWDLSICIDVVEAGLDNKSEKVSVWVQPVKSI